MPKTLPDWAWMTIGVVGLVAVALASYLLTRLVLMPLVRRAVGRTSFKWDDVLLDSKLLHETITELRDSLEQMRHQRLAAVQEALAQSANEITQLRETVSSLRDELEALQILVMDTPDGCEWRVRLQTSDAD